MRSKALKALLVSGLMALVLALASCGNGSSTETQAEEPTAAESGESEPATGESPAPAGEGEKPERSVKVDISNFQYEPDPVRVAVGGKVIWMNEDSIAHTATAVDGSFDTGEIEEGKLESETFKQPGTFTYHCEIHPQMHGTIEVVEG